MSSEEYVFAWLQVLDELTYYDLFAVAPDAGADEIRVAFHAFCDTFHPDRHAARPEDEREALATVFKRGTEAFLVLSDDVMRGHYDAQLLTQPPSPNPPRISFSPLSRPPPASRAPGQIPLDEAIRSPAARPFARRAEELVKKGDYRQAKLQLVMANHMDPGNEALEAALREIEEKLHAK
ncbi:MAG TPA: DnaJ domain-containing protein [Polyangiaceae bacterium]|jgi:curved DNA-binding protein CbpA